MEIKVVSMILLLFFVRAFKTAKINDIVVPSHYLENIGNKPLVLKCDFSVDEEEKGFVLKWLHNSIPIYQWIPQRQPYALGSYRGRIDLEYSASEEEYKKHSALAIIDPSILDTGNFTCDVQTFISSDKKTAQMIVVHPEQEVNIKYTIDEQDQIVSLECSVLNVYPLPEIKFLFDDEEKSISVDTETQDASNLFNVTIKAQVSKNDIRDESLVTCLMKISDTEYEAKKTIIYDDPKQTSTTKISIDGENMFASELNDENNSVLIQSKLGFLVVVLINIILGERILNL